MIRLAAALFAGGLVLCVAAGARAEYRAYELEITDVYDCRVNQRDPCRRSVVRTSMDPQLYVRTHGGPDRLGVVLLATWMCYGDTSNYRDVCPRPAPREARFNPGDRVRVNLGRHITDGWEGTVEVAYYQASVQSNVYGVRFAEKQEVYARYFELHLQPIAAGEGEGEAGTEGAGEGEGQAAGGGQGEPAAAGEGQGQPGEGQGGAAQPEPQREPPQ